MGNAQAADFFREEINVVLTSSCARASRRTSPTSSDLAQAQQGALRVAGLPPATERRNFILSGVSCDPQYQLCTGVLTALKLADDIALAVGVVGAANQGAGLDVGKA